MFEQLVLNTLRAETSRRRRSDPRSLVMCVWYLFARFRSFTNSADCWCLTSLLLVSLSNAATNSWTRPFSFFSLQHTHRHTDAHAHTETETDKQRQTETHTHSTRTHTHTHTHTETDTYTQTDTETETHILTDFDQVSVRITAVIFPEEHFLDWSSSALLYSPSIMF